MLRNALCKTKLMRAQRIQQIHSRLVPDILSCLRPEFCVCAAGAKRSSGLGL